MLISDVLYLSPVSDKQRSLIDECPKSPCTAPYRLLLYDSNCVDYVAASEWICKNKKKLYDSAITSQFQTLEKIYGGVMISFL